MTRIKQTVFNPIMLSLVLMSGAMAMGDQKQPAATIRFAGNSTLHGFSGTATPEPMRVDSGRMMVSIPVSTMNTGNGARDRRMAKMLDMEHYPTITGSTDKLRFEQAGAGSQLPVAITIRDVTRTVTAICQRIESENDVVLVSMDLQISLREFELEAPTVMGLIRVDDQVSVTATWSVASVHRAGNEPRINDVRIGHTIGR